MTNIETKVLSLEAMGTVTTEFWATVHLRVPVAATEGQVVEYLKEKAQSDPNCDIKTMRFAGQQSFLPFLQSSHGWTFDTLSSPKEVDASADMELVFGEDGKLKAKPDDED